MVMPMMNDMLGETGQRWPIAVLGNTLILFIYMLSCN